MRSTLILLFICISAINVSAQNAHAKVGKLDSNKPLLTAQAACGECKLGLKVRAATSQFG